MRALEAALYRLFVCRLHSKLNLWANRRATPGALGKSAGDDPDSNFSHDCRTAGLAGSRRPVGQRASLSTGWEAPQLRRLFSLLGAGYLRVVLFERAETG